MNIKKFEIFIYVHKDYNIKIKDLKKPSIAEQLKSKY